IIPQAEDWFFRAVVLVSSDPQRTGATQEITAMARRKPQPARGKHAEEMAVGEDRHIAACFANSLNYTVRTDSNLCRPLALGAAVPKQVPPWPFLKNLRRSEAFVSAVVPLPKVGVHQSCRGDSSQLAGPPSTLQGTGQHQSKS